MLKLLQSISRTARIIQTDDPSFPNTFHLPERESAHAVLTSARLFARDIDAVAKRLVDHALPETIVADLKAALEMFEQSILRREVGKGESAAARVAIDEMGGWAGRVRCVALTCLDISSSNRLSNRVVLPWQTPEVSPHIRSSGRRATRPRRARRALTADRFNK